MASIARGRLYACVATLPTHHRASSPAAMAVVVLAGLLLAFAPAAQAADPAAISISSVSASFPAQYRQFGRFRRESGDPSRFRPGFYGHQLQSAGRHGAV